ncbi:MAG: TolC family protein [Acidobacteria bacterium]|nr:TolC family protein [Acidobacteriota bacterium]
MLLEFMHRVLLLLALLTAAVAVSGQTKLVDATYTIYHSQNDGISLAEIVKLAFETNSEIKIAQLEVDRAKARLTQAGLRPNPTLEVEQSSGRLLGSPGDSEFSTGISIPLELYGQRNRRIERARAEIILKEAEIGIRRREIVSRIVSDYADALSAFREIKILDEIIDIDLQTVKFVQIRVNEGETAPLELSLLQTEVERLRVQRQLIEGRLQTAITKLKYFAGVPYEQPLRLREELPTATFPSLPPSTEVAIAVGLKSRPEIRVAELDEQLGNAGLRLIRAEAKPEFSAFTKFSLSRSTIDLPTGSFPQGRDRNLLFGITIGLPVFDRKQGAKAEAAITVRQAQERRTFAEGVIRNEITIAFQQLETARKALIALETNVLPRSRENIETIRQVYRIGQLKITDLLVEQRRLIDANRDVTETLTKKYKAEADLYIALGLTFDN